MDDERLDQIIKSLQVGNGGFANYVVMQDELLAAMQELKKRREAPAHCPGCDGDHL